MDDSTTAGIRTSGSNPSLKPISNRTVSARSIASHVENYGHPLWKPKAQAMEKDLPLPPLLSDGRLPSANGNTAQIVTPNIPASQDLTPIDSPADGTEPLFSSLAKDIRLPADDHDHFFTRRLPVSKVRPAVYDVKESSASPMASEDAYLVENHFQNSRANTPKVRPFTDYFSSVPPRPSQGAYSVEKHFRHRRADTPKVRPAEHGAERSKETYDIRDHFRHRRANTPKVHSFTDYISSVPPLRSEEAYPLDDHFRHSHANTSKVRSFVNPSSESSRQQPGMPGSRGESPHFPQFGSQNVVRETPIVDTKSDSRQENLQHGEVQNSPDSSRTQSEGLLASKLPASVSTPSSANVDAKQNSSLPQKLGTSRTARWLRGMLGYSEDGKISSLTKLPKKSSLRRESHDDASSVASGVTHYSDKDSANKAAMTTAMHSLEQLMTEALSLANETGDQTHGHVDNGDLPLKSASDASIQMPSVHKSISRGSIEHVEVDSVRNRSTPVHADLESHNERGEALPSKSAKQQMLAAANEQEGKVIKRASLGSQLKPASIMKTHHLDISDDEILPMPPPDFRIRRRSSHSGPLAYKEDDPTGVIKPRSGEVPNSREVREYIRVFHQPPIANRGSSKATRENEGLACEETDSSPARRLADIRCQNTSAYSLNDDTSDDIVDFSTLYSPDEKRYPRFGGFQRATRQIQDEKLAQGSVKQRTRRGRPARHTPTQHAHELKNVSLRNKSHVSIGEGQPFSFKKSARRQPTIARDWSPARKRFVAAVACTSTALVGVLVGIYAGLVPSIQYYIADFHHYAILGNVGFYLGMAVPSLICWPLPLLHGRKPYTVGGLCIAMPLLFPQALAISTRRSPYTSVWTLALLLSRALMGFFLGFASMNFHSILTDLFGASLMSNNPHQEVVDEFDVRRHGGGLGVWLGIWTWCSIGTLSVGFLVGAIVIDYLQPSWGLYISIIIMGIVLLLNVFCPEVRRSAWRRSVTEVQSGETISRRLARGEIMMHRVHNGPRWWGQEVYHGLALSLEMLRQPGFAVMAVYSAWIYAQVVLVIVLLGALASRSYRYRSTYVGAAVSSVAIGAFAAIPFQKANIFSRARNMSPQSNVMTFDKKITWSSRFVRRTIFTLVLPIAGIVYTVVASGPPMHVVVPSAFAALIGFLSCLAISECNGMLMEAWDCSDLQPGMTGRSKSSKDSHKRTNYSSFPRVTAGWNMIHGLGFIFAAGATGLGGSVTRQLGQRAATGIVAIILLGNSLLLLGTLLRFKRIQIIPDCTCSEMDQWRKERRRSYHNWAAALAAAKEHGTEELNEIPEDDVG
ncbi:hypothetical protein F4808DRAFT_180245 [Astrocystis sublimbata]|nr:hypothetical protein F4808DRAFT_180245 [Astrocystis sublimbata]